jgi:CheY-like chemotaxis protein
MHRLKILMADDQQIEIDDARKALKEMAHEVIAVSTFDEAMKQAQDETFDIAVVDLGWYTDATLKGKMSDEDTASAGWRILELIRAKNPDTVRILYSARTDEPKITQAATEQNIYCIQKEFSKKGRLHLADVVKVIAYHLAREKELKEKVNKIELELQKSFVQIQNLETSKEKVDSEQRTAIEKSSANKMRKIESELEKALAKIQDLEKLKNEAVSEKYKFNRILITVTLVPTVSFILFIAAWQLTQQLTIAVLAFVGGAFLSLAALSATGSITSYELKYLGTLLQSLFRKP